MDAKTIDDKLDRLVEATVDNLLNELSHYRRQSEHLRKVNALYQRMAGILDLPSMLEAYSIWLAEHVRHDLIGYRNPARQRMHMFCSCHGPRRRLAVAAAEDILARPLEANEQSVAIEDFFSHRWAFETSDCYGMLVLMRQGSIIPEEELFLVDESLTVLAEPLKRAMDYEEIFAQARRDALTGLPNRTVFNERIDQIIEQARRHHHPLTLAAIDLDHFKAVNDTMGRLIGDRVLQQVAKALAAQIRTTDLLIRMGGDEFLLVLPDTGMAAARHLAERLCLAVERLEINTVAGRLGVSIGLSQWHQHLTREQWLERADDILYQAKANGRAQVAVN